LHEDGGAVVGGVFAQDNAETPLPTSRARRFLRSPNGKRAEVLTVKLQEVEGVKHGFADGTVAMQRIEDRDAVWPTYERFPVDREGCGAKVAIAG
jgi:hypothetical protein